MTIDTPSTPTGVTPKPAKPATRRRNTSTLTPAEAVSVLRHLKLLGGLGAAPKGAAADLAYLAGLVADTTPQGRRTLDRLGKSQTAAEQRVTGALVRVRDGERPAVVAELQTVVNDWVAAQLFKNLAD
mgnify:CR=1 FL=1